MLYIEDDLPSTKKLILNTDEMHQAPFALTTSSCLKVGVDHCTILQTSQSLVTEIIEVLNFPS
ncbi:unnamed protein product, partial [Rotaria sp. Silwood1]